ncbi:YwqI/YxiC family protein [Fictibacillus aquaticus]|uniref:YwqI/YxiC family protein n=1 Tax=Fictibacillus aquaticus TaxID=2021314 RepID=A0A235F5K9_9BACL|nr:YwqI/YxiC family protein [Fictibacillus aquaticus]OYD56550.1 hypothetical protein CGZ90_16185 [Fictibacillus aquaticus]
MSEIRIKYNEVEAALSQLQSAVQALEPVMPEDISGLNILETVDELNNINNRLQQTLTAYQELLSKNTQGTREAVNLMEETDKDVASGMMQR